MAVNRRLALAASVVVAASIGFGAGYFAHQPPSTVTEGPRPRPLLNTVLAPGVVGEPLSKAASALQSVGFRVQVRAAHSKSVPAGVILRQVPGAGVRLPSGSTI